MNCVVIFVDVKLKKNRFPRINSVPHASSRIRGRVERVTEFTSDLPGAWSHSGSNLSIETIDV